MSGCRLQRGVSLLVKISVPASSFNSLSISTLRAEADRLFEVEWLKVAGFSESGVGDAPAAWAFGKLSDWGNRFLCECVPRLAGAEPPDSESPATLSASARSVSISAVKACAVPDIGKSFRSNSQVWEFRLLPAFRSETPSRGWTPTGDCGWPVDFLARGSIEISRERVMIGRAGVRDRVCFGHDG